MKTKLGFEEGNKKGEEMMIFIRVQRESEIYRETEYGMRSIFKMDWRDD